MQRLPGDFPEDGCSGAHACSSSRFSSYYSAMQKMRVLADPEDRLQALHHQGSK
jgi:hypothetical protein